jgi:hypothetical protein
MEAELTNDEDEVVFVLQEGGSALEHLATFKEIVADLKYMEVEYGDEDLGLILLCSLPTSFVKF